jgi:oligopeptide transport system substrate-binding protein
MTFGRKAFRLSALALTLALVAGACGGGNGGDNGGAQGTDGDPVSGGVLTDLQNFASGEPQHLDPGLSSSIQDSQPGQLIFDGLTENDYKTGELKPMVAESFSSNEDSTVWTFKLRRGVTFSNGDPVLPSDFKYAWERVVQKEFGSKVAYHFDPIKGKAAVDEGTTKELSGVRADDANMTLTVEMAFPYSAFAATTSHLVFSPVPKNVVQALPDQTKWEQGIMIGNGPFKMKEAWQHDRSVTLVRNETYWGGLNNHKAYLDEIVFRISKDVDSAFADFEAGNGHTGYIPPGRFAEAKAKYAGRNATEPSLGAYYWVFNMKDPAVGGPDNKKLREAIALAIDRQAIVDTVYNGSRRVATGLTPPGLPGYKEGLDRESGRDLERAKTLMREYGKTPPTIKINFNAGSGHEPVATIVQANLRDIGINSELDPRDRTTYFNTLRQGTGQFARAGWIGDYVSYDNWTYPLYHSKSIGGDNLAHYSNPAVDTLIDNARKTRDEGERNRMYQEAERLMLEDQAMVPLNWYTGSIVYAPDVRNFIQSPLLFVAYGEIWLEK